MGKLPSFISGGSTVVNRNNRFVSWKAGELKSLILMTGVDEPEGEEQTGKNCVLHFDQYSIWMTEKERPDGVPSPMWPALYGPEDPGKLIGLKSKFKALALVMDPETREEKIWAMTKSVFDQLAPIENALGRSLKGGLINVLRTGEKLNTRYTVSPPATFYDLEGEPDLDLVEWVGPTTRDEIIAMLTTVGKWPPVGGDPYAADA